jgi:hypothetical protein
MVRLSDIYEDVSSDNVQVRAGGHALPVNRATREADVRTVETKSERNQTHETSTPKEWKEFCFCIGASPAQSKGLAPSIRTNCVGFNLRTEAESSPQSGVINKKWDERQCPKMNHCIYFLVFSSFDVPSTDNGYVFTQRTERFVDGCIMFIRMAKVTMHWYVFSVAYVKFYFIWMVINGQI